MTEEALKKRTLTAMEFFVGQGWERHQAAGIVANLVAESGIQSIPQHGGGPAFGIAQWEGPRQADFKRWAGHVIRESTIADQLAFVQHELDTTEAAAARALRNATTAAEAGALVCRLYERPADIDGQSKYRASLAVEIDTSADFSNVVAGVETTAPKVP